MAEPPGSRTAVPRAGENASRGFFPRWADFGALRLAILGLGVLGGALMLVSDFMTLYHVDVITARCSDLASPNLRSACTTTGGGHHGYGLAILGAIVLLMTWGAALGGSRPAGIALLVLGGAGLAIVLAVDLPDIHKTGIVGDQFSSAKANPGAGLWLEFAGCALTLGAGLLRLTRPGNGPLGGSARRRRARAREPGSETR